MTGYVRKDTSNNIADGNIINASDLDAEFDGVQDAFNSSTGHKHDGTSGEGAPITAVGPVQDVVISATAVTPKTTNTVDLGSSSLKFKDIFIAGTATLPTVSATTGNITTVNATTVDTTNVEVTNIKAKDGTASATIANSTGVMTIASAILTTADINGGTIDGTAIGGTAAAAGAFTTLSSTGNTTLGDASTDTVTVNGYMGVGAAAVGSIGLYVAPTATTSNSQYGFAVDLSATSGATTVIRAMWAKARTPAAAVTFARLDGLNITNAVKGAGSTITDQYGLIVDDQTQGTNNYGITSLVSSGTNKWNIYASGTADNYFAGNVGIGTNAPVSLLDLTQSGATSTITLQRSIISSGAGLYQGQLQFGSYSTGTTTVAGSAIRGESDGTWTSTSAAGRLLFYTTASGATTLTERMRLDASGNLGLGVTPSAWQSNWKAIETYSGSIASLGTSVALRIYANAYVASGGVQTYKNSDFATRYEQVSGTHAWYNAPSGTAGNAITFTQAMTLDASGNLGVGTTSTASTRMTIVGGALPTQDNGNTNALQFAAGVTGRRASSNTVGFIGTYANASSIEISAGQTGSGLSIHGQAASANANTVIAYTNSLERLRIDASGNLGIGTSSPVARLHVAGDAIRFNDPSATYFTGFSFDTTAGTGGSLISQLNTSGYLELASGTAANTNSTIRFRTANTERLRIDSSGNLGLGVTPSAWASTRPALQVRNVSVSASTGNTSNAYFSANTYTDGSGVNTYISTNFASIYQQTNGAHLWFTAPSGTAGTAISFTQAMTLDASGNLGIGTPSPTQELHLYKDQNATTEILIENPNSGTGGRAQLELSPEFGSAYFTANSSTSTVSAITGGALGAGLYTSSLLTNGLSVGTTAGPLKFFAGSTSSERARIDTSGNLGLGVTPSAWQSAWKALELAGGSFAGSSDRQLVLQNVFVNTSGVLTYSTTAAASFYRQVVGTHQWHTAPSGTAGTTATFTQAMTLDASGNWLLGTTTAPSSGNLQGVVADTGGAGLQFTRTSTVIGGGYINTAGQSLVFGTHTGTVGSETYTERARIDSGGNLLVGKTATDISAVGWHLNPSATGASSQVITISSGTNEAFIYNNTSTGGNARVDFRVANVSKGNIQWNNTNTAYNTTSDYRLKENIQPMTGALAKVAALKPCTYKWKADGSDGEGFIAHELAEVVPQCVTGEKDAVDADGNPVYQGIDTSFLVATLAAAIQELKAEFDAYKAAHP